MNQATIPADVIKQVNQIMASEFEISSDKLIPTATLTGDLGLDSLDAVDMLVHLEEKLNVKVGGDRLANMKTLQDVYVLAQESMLSSSPQTQTRQ